MTAHRKVIEAQRGSLKYAIECGKYLNTAKETVKAEKTGRWMQWLTNNCPDLNKRTARLYMLLAKNEDKLDQAAINEAVIEGALSIRRAAQLITGGAAEDDDDDEGAEAAEGEDEGDSNAGAGTSPTTTTKSGSPDLVELLKNSAPDEVFSVLKTTWTDDYLNALADLLDTHLNSQAQAA
jgi:hypothetical protein